MSRRVDIIGGGISGISTAYFLSKTSLDLDIHVWEKDNDPGGLAGVFFANGFEVEKYYHHIYRRDKAIQDLLEELGLGDRLLWEKALTATYYQGVFYRLASPLDLLKYKPLSLLDRFRLGKMVLLAKRVKNWLELDERYARDYVIEAAGENVYRIVWEPLFKGKFGSFAEQISAVWLWSKLTDRGASRNKGGHEVLGYVRGGLGFLFREMRTRIEAAGHRVHLNSPVQNLDMKDGRISRIVTAQGTFETDLVVGATQVPDLADILDPAPESYRSSLKAIDFLGNVCLILILDRSLTDYYWINIAHEDSPFVGVIEHTKWLGTEEFGGKHVVYLSAYVEPGDARMDLDAKGLIDAYEPTLKKMFPDFDRASIEKSFVWKTPYAQPIMKPGYGKIRPAIQSPIDNLLVCTMAQIYPHDREVSNGIEMAQKTVDVIVKKVEGATP